jgi:peptide-methionine (S)-S-oxide reductase
MSRLQNSIRKLLALASVLIWGEVIMLEAQKPPTAAPTPSTTAPTPAGPLEVATFGSGCFWCTEAVFEQLRGVISVESGYSGGTVKNPTYKQVCTGLTGHAECVRILFDPKIISYAELLEVFWQSHDPTTPNQQGADIGTQYRSVIFYHNEQQRHLAESYKKKLDEARAFRAPIVTQIVPAAEFYRAEDYHQNYYKLNRQAPYCQMVIRPKLDKVKKVFAEKLKEDKP